MSEQWDYKKAGLDLAKYEQTIEGIQAHLARTQDRTRVIPPPFPPRKGGKGVGGFASLFDLGAGYTHPVLVNCTDGVGSKLKIAALMQKYDTVGIDLVAMSVNDLICTGGEPLTFLDYIAMPSDDPTGTAAPPPPTHEMPAADPPTAAAASGGTGMDELAGQDPPARDETGGSNPSSYDSGPDPDGQPHPDDSAGYDSPPQRPPRGATRTAVIQTYRQDPTLHPTAIAEAVGTSERSVRRYLDELRASAGADASHGRNGIGNSHNGPNGRRGNNSS